MSRTPLPTKKGFLPTTTGGCFKVTYPHRQWRAIACATPPPYPQPPRFFTQPNTDVVAVGPKGYISTAKGSFDRVTVKSEKGQIANDGAEVPNAYTLQLNTNTFKSKVCDYQVSPNCLAWQQFVFVNDGTKALAFIQYWIIKYNKPCPAGWYKFTPDGSSDTYCYKNSSNGIHVEKTIHGRPPANHEPHKSKPDRFG